MRKLLAILLCAVCSLASAEQAVRVHTTKGDSVDILFSHSPVLRFSSDTLEIESYYTNYLWEIGSVNKFTFVDVESTDIFNRHTTRRVYTDGAKIYVLSENTYASLYSSSGVCLSVDYFIDEGVLDLQQRCPGVYILKLDAANWQQSFKIHKSK